jgi:hypothetical protein
MRRFKLNPATFVIVEIGILLLSLALTAFWDWACWTKGFPGSPGWFAKFTGAHGEFAYDAQTAEMFLILLIVLNAGFGAFCFSLKRDS